MATKYWRVENMATNGWNITDPRLDVKLTKDQAKVRLEAVSYTHLTLPTTPYV